MRKLIFAVLFMFTTNSRFAATDLFYPSRRRMINKGLIPPRLIWIIILPKIHRLKKRWY
jgi:hypothetical protein